MSLQLFKKIGFFRGEGNSDEKKQVFTTEADGTHQSLICFRALKFTLTEFAPLSRTLKLSDLHAEGQRLASITDRHEGGKTLRDIASVQSKFPPGLIGCRAVC